MAPAGMPMAYYPQQGVPMASYPQQGVPMASFPQPMMAAGTPGPQQSVLGTAAIGLLLNNPGLIDRLLGALGRLLMRRGLPRVEMNAATPAAFQAPASYTMAPAAAPFAAAPSFVPAGQPALFAIPQIPVMSAAPPAAPAAAPPVFYAAPTASPQGETPIYASPQSHPVHKSLFQKLKGLHHD